MGGRVMTAGELAKILSKVEPHLVVYGPDGDGVAGLIVRKHDVVLNGNRKGGADNFGKLIRAVEQND